MLKKENILNSLTICYFVIAFIEVLSEYLVSNPVICVLKPALPVFLIILYYIESDRKSVVFTLALLLSSLTNILFIPNTASCLFYAVLVFTIHRILVLYLIFLHQKLKDYIPILSKIPH